MATKTVRNKMTYLIQVDEDVREATAAEIAVIETLQTEQLNAKNADAEKAQAKEAIIAKLGITAEEAQILLS
jgi:hypothetical protein